VIFSYCLFFKFYSS